MCKTGLVVGFGAWPGAGVAPVSPPRLTAEFWVSAYLARVQAAGIPVYVTARGDPTAGAVMVKCATLNGRAQVFHRRWDMDSDARVWAVAAEGTEAEVDALIARERARDRDLWVIEIEDRAGRTLLDEDGLSG